MHQNLSSPLKIQPLFGPTVADENPMRPVIQEGTPTLFNGVHIIARLIAIDGERNAGADALR